MRILEAVEPSVRKCMKGLDNYAAEGAKAVDDLKKIASLLGKLSKGAEWQERVLTSLTAGKQYLKMEYKMHISSESEIVDLCCQYALSDDSEEFSSYCCHNHNVSCRSCYSLADILQELENAAKEVTFDNEDQQDDTMYTLSQSIKAVEAWKKHILRSVNQDKARSDIMMSSQDNEVLVERDLAMKFLPMLYRESQSKWFGKRGLNWHVSVGNYKIEEEFYTHTIVHVFDSAIQDAKTSNAVLKDTLARLHARNPAFNTAFVRSDNAGCFHGTEAVCCVPSLGKSTGKAIKKMDFSDPQGGKSICDRKAAHIKSSIRKFINEGNNVCTALEYKEAIEKSNLKNVEIVVSAPPSQIDSFQTKSCKIPNVTTLYNFVFEPDFIQVFKQFGIGSGKVLTH